MTHPFQSHGASATPARVLVVGTGPDLTDAAASAVRAAGHDVVRASSWAGALGMVGDQQAEAVVVSAWNLDAAPLKFCERLRESGGATGPILFVLPRPVELAHRKTVLRAGATHVFEAPLDAEEVRLQLDAALASTREVGRARATALVDAETGLYNWAGLARRGRELTSGAMRGHSALSCVVLGATFTEGSAILEACVATADALRAKSRLSDIIGRVGQFEFVVLAPGTGSAGVGQVASRLQSGVAAALGRATYHVRGRVHAGYNAIENLAYAPVESGEVLARAVSALRSRKQNPFFQWLPAAEFAAPVV